MLEFRPPKRKKIVIFDGHGSEHVSMCLPKKSYVILHTRYEKINFFILFKCLLNLKFKYRDYLKEFINYVKPKILLTYIDNNYFFYQIKFKFLKKISLQNGHRTESLQDFFYQIKNKKLNLNSDFIFLHCHSIGKLYQKYIKTSIKVFGSFRSNLTKISKKKIYTLGYVSTWRSTNLQHRLYKDYTWEDWLETDKILLRNLKMFCENKKIKLHVIGCANEKESEKEKLFYDEMLGRKYSFIPNNNKRNVYSLADKFKALVGNDSTLLYENFGRGNKTAFFAYRSKEYPFNTRKFGWPGNIKEDGNFWTTKKDLGSFSKTLDYVLKCEKKNWEKNYKKYYPHVMSYDANNSKFSKLIKQLLKN